MTIYLYVCVYLYVCMYVYVVLKFNLELVLLTWANFKKNLHKFLKTYMSSGML